MSTHDYESLQALAKELGRRLDSLYALDGGNDPFVADRPGRRETAEWFAALWPQFTPEGSKPHVRRIHYRLISSTTPILRPGGEAYENTHPCWNALCKAARDARYLNLIPAGSIIDQRNPEPAIFLVDEQESAANIWPSMGTFDAVSVELPEPQLLLPTGLVSEPVIPQRYHVEIWCEKSTMNDVLMPLGEQYGVNIVTGVGEMSTTQVEDLVARLRTIRRPVRILYISDFDPGGLSMPVSVARKIEFEIAKVGEQHDVQLRWIVLTPEQCVEYRLPRTPIKETERRAAKFEARFGEGATELDALEALYSGELRRLVERELRRLVERELRRYYDAGLKRRIRKVAGQAEREVAAVQRDVYARHAAAIAEVENDHQQLVAEIAAMRERIAELQAEFEERAQPTFDAIESDLEAELPDADDYAWPEPKDGDEDDDPLYDSSRDYLDQLERYREHQGKSGSGDLAQYDLTCAQCGEPFQSRRRHAKLCRRPECKTEFYRNLQREKRRRKRR